MATDPDVQQDKQQQSSKERQGHWGDIKSFRQFLKSLRYDKKKKKKKTLFAYLTCLVTLQNLAQPFVSVGLRGDVMYSQPT